MILTIILISCVWLLALIIVWFKINFNYWTHYPQIPSLPGRIFSGNFLDFITFKTNFSFHLKKIYQDKKFENAAAVGIYCLYRPVLLIREPELIKSIFIKDFDSFVNRTSEADEHDPLGSLNLFFARYPYWKIIRAKLVPVFSSGKLKNFYPLIQKVGNNLEDFLQKQPNCFVYELTDLCGRYAIDVLSTTILGTITNSLENPKEFLFPEACKLVDFNYKRSLNLLIIFFAPKLNTLVRPKFFYESTEKYMRSYINDVIASRESSGNIRNDLIDAFVKIKQEAEIKGENISDCIDGLIAQACILLLAAFDSTCKIISLVLLELAKHQEIQERLREEILHAFAKENNTISYESLNNLEYLEMVISETLRLYPAIYFVERMHEHHPNKSSIFNLQPFCDYELPNKMSVYVSVAGLHHDEKYWPNSQKFDPERFNSTNKKRIKPMTYLPFGKGPHMCIGSLFGMLLVKVAIVHFLKNHYVRVCAKTITEPELEPKAVILQTKGGIHVEFVKINSCLKEVHK